MCGACRGKFNKSAGSFAVFRGQYAAQVDVSCLQAPTLYPAWLRDPLMVGASFSRFQHYEMSSTMLSADQVRSGNERLEHGPAFGLHRFKQSMTHVSATATFLSYRLEFNFHLLYSELYSCW
jgi:hypothetical protein